jgi:hypothetical protein
MSSMGKSLITWATVLSFVALSGCEEPTTFVPTSTDRFSYYDRDLYNQANEVLQADYLFVTDVSYSMVDEVDNVLSSLDGFANYLRDEEIDYRIGFVRGTTSSRGDTYKYIPKTLIGPAFTNKTTAVTIENLIRAQLEIEGFGTPNAPNAGFMLEAARRTANNSSLGFLREAAQLVYVFISDTDDISSIDSFLNRGVASYVESLSVKTDASYINARAWVTGQSADCVTNTAEGDKPGNRLAQAARALNTGSSEEIHCLYESDLSGSLQDLARNVTRPTKRFKLRATPVVSTITITVDGVPSVRGTDWDYVAATKEVVFRTGHEPGPSTELDIQYSPVLRLSTKPKDTSLVVTVDGSAIPKNNNEGYTYDASKNEILFQGSYKPDEGSEIRVTYQGS